MVTDFTVRKSAQKRSVTTMPENWFGNLSFGGLSGVLGGTVAYFSGLLM
jgi:hypothetical protein